MSSCCHCCLEEKVKKLEAELENARAAARAWATQDPEQMLDTLHICGIPAREMKEIYEVEHWYRMHSYTSPGGDNRWRKQQLALIAANKLADACIAGIASYAGHAPVWPIRDAVAEFLLAYQEAFPISGDKS